MPFHLWDRNGIWYYRLQGEKTFHSTSIKSDKKINKRRAEQWVLKNKVGRTRVEDMSFRKYADPYFVWDRCPRVRRKLRERKSIGKKHVRLSRRLLEKYVFTDRFAQITLGAMLGGDIEDLRDRLIEKCGAATVNRTISAVKAVLSEALYREEIHHNPGSLISPIIYNRAQKGILSVEELRTLFAEVPGVWDDIQTHAVFNTAAKTGVSGHSLRRSLNTHLLTEGCDPFKVRAYLGWSSNFRAPVLTPVQEGYTHLRAEDLRDLLPAIDRIFRTDTEY